MAPRGRTTTSLTLRSWAGGRWCCGGVGGGGRGRQRGAWRLPCLALLAYVAYTVVSMLRREGDYRVDPGGGGANGSSKGKDGGDAFLSEVCAAQRGCGEGEGGETWSGSGSRRLRIEAVALRLPAPDPATGRSRHYSANHWFHISEFHMHNHARLRALGALLPRKTLSPALALAAPGAAVPAASSPAIAIAEASHPLAAGSEVEAEAATGGGVAAAAIAVRVAGRGIVIQLADPAWSQQLTPMTRLLLALAYTDGSAEQISYAPPGTLAAGAGAGGAQVEFNGGGGGASGGEAALSSPPGSVTLSCGWTENSWHASSAQDIGDRFVVDAGVGKDGGGRGGENDGRGGGDNEDGGGRNGCEPSVAELSTLPGASVQQGQWQGRARRGGHATVRTSGVTLGAVKAERGEWAPKLADVASLRKSLERLCAPPLPSTSLSSPSSSSNPSVSATLSQIGGGGDGGDGSGSGGSGGEVDAEASARAALESAPCMFSDTDDKVGGLSNSGRGGSTRARSGFHAVIYQRNSGRQLEGAERAAAHLAAALGPGWKVSVVMHHDRLPPCALAKCLGAAGVLVTPHGFQSMLYLMLPPGALLYEVFPHRYYKHGYKRAALEWGLSHGMTMSAPSGHVARLISHGFTTAQCMSMFYCRYLARKGDVALEARDIVAIARAAAAEKAAGNWKQAAVAHASAASGNGGGSYSGGDDVDASPETRVVLCSRSASRADCLAACAADHSCQRFRLMLGAVEAEARGRSADLAGFGV